MCVCVCYQRVCVGEYVCFLEAVNRNLFRRFSISAGVAQRERKIRLPAARYYLLSPPYIILSQEEVDLLHVSV